jgi:Ca2+/Na+ antiporter
VVITELPFLLSIAALSLSLAGLAGLVAGLRRGDGLRPIDRFRLREIVEFAFANALLALSIVPLASLTGSVETAVRIGAIAAGIYLVAIAGVLYRRLRHADIEMTTWVRIAAILDLMIVIPAVAAIATGSLAVLQVMFILFLARPMVAFLFVLASFDEDESTSRPSP